MIARSQVEDHSCCCMEDTLQRSNLVWSAVDRQEWHYSSPVLTALVLKLVRLLHLDRVDDGDCAGDADEKKHVFATRET